MFIETSQFPPSLEKPSHPATVGCISTRSQLAGEQLPPGVGHEASVHPDSHSLMLPAWPLQGYNLHEDQGVLR